LNSYFNSAYTYNLLGALIEETYPSGRVVKNTLSNDGDLSQVQSRKANDTFRNYANSFNYTAAGAVSSMRLGNGKWENTTFNSRLQPIQIGLGSSATNQDLLKLDYEYGVLNTGTGQVIAGTNNGNLAKQTITVQNTATVNGFSATQYYAYDSLNRIQTASENLTPNGQAAYNFWKQTFTYDRFGNRRFDAANTTTILAVCNPTIDPATNKLVGYGFDSSGNTKVDANSQTFIYDAENKQVEVKNSSNGIVGQYFYDGDGKRVKKIVPSTGETTLFVYDASGKMVAEYSTQVATTPQVSYLTSDHLGSPRINTDANGQVIARHDYQPFGEEIARASYGADSTRQKFTSYERDTESGLNFAQARYQNDSFGRFTSPDPMMASATKINPQTFNRYIYVDNNPLNLTDPTGMCPPEEEPCFTQNGKEIPGHYLNGVYTYDFSGDSVKTESAPAPINAPAPGANPGPGFNPFPNAQTGGPLTQTSTNSPTSQNSSSATNFGKNIARSARTGPLGFLLSLTINELINPSQSVGGDPCDQGIPDCQEDEENRKIYYRGLNPDGTDPAARLGSDVRLLPDGTLNPNRGISINTDPTKIPSFLVPAPLLSYPRDQLHMVNTSGTHYELAPYSNMTHQDYLEAQKKIRYGPLIRR
jgi:RHS repeat-associated protein